MIIDTLYSIQQVFYAPYCRKIGDGMYEGLVAKKVITGILVVVDINELTTITYQVDHIGMHHSVEYFSQMYSCLGTACRIADECQKNGVELHIMESI